MLSEIITRQKSPLFNQVIKAADIADHLFQLLKDGSAKEYFGEKISQLDHCLQSAEQAIRANSDIDTILGALLHDIGQFLSTDERNEMRSNGDGVKVGVMSHDKLGEIYLRKLGFSEKVCVLVGSHVEAKRYLTGKDSTYYNKLSDASKASLKCQGGPYTQEEVKEFENSPHCQEIIQLRFWDDKAKIENYECLPLDFYREMIIYHLLKEGKL